jgi:hypothetical protein
LTACYLSENGSEEMRTFELKELVKFQETLKLNAQVAVEATGNTRHFREAIKSLVSKVVVVNPNQFEVIRKSVKKTDRHDARMLALFLSKDMLPKSRLKQLAHAQLNSVAHSIYPPFSRRCRQRLKSVSPCSSFIFPDLLKREGSKLRALIFGEQCPSSERIFMK